MARKTSDSDAVTSVLVYVFIGLAVVISLPFIGIWLMELPAEKLIDVLLYGTVWLGVLVVGLFLWMCAHIEHH